MFPSSPPKSLKNKYKFWLLETAAGGKIEISAYGFLSHLTKPEARTPAILSADTGETQRHSLVVVERENLTDHKTKECVLMEKKFIINRVDLGQSVTGYEVFNPAVNGVVLDGDTIKCA